MNFCIFFNIFVKAINKNMKKIFSFIITILALSTLSSCSLFKPVQKRCPAYSLEINQNIQQELVSLNPLDNKNN